MNTATRTLTTMIIALAMIGMLSGIGAALPVPTVATTTMDYDVDFHGIGDGFFHIGTNTPAGNDLMGVDWTNCEATGTQTGVSGGDGWTKINRDVDITGTPLSGVASGTVYTRSEMLSGDYTPASVTAYAGYYDNNAGSDGITFGQYTALGDSDATPNTGCDGIGTTVTIHGYAYGDNLTHVSGGVSSVTDGSNNVSTMVGAYVHDGSLDMDVDSGIMDDVYNREGSGTDFDIDVSSPNSRADGYVYGAALIGGVPQNPVENNTLSMTFSGVDTVDADGTFVAWTPSMPGIPCFDLLMNGMTEGMPEPE